MTSNVREVFMSQDVSLQIETLETRASAESGESKRLLLGKAAQVADAGGASSAEVARLYINAASNDPFNPGTYLSLRLN